MKLLKRRTTFVLLALLCGAGLSACSTEPKPNLEAIPVPQIVTVKVPTYISLPADATSPCARPAKRPIVTDVDLLKAADAWKVTAICNANKLAAIAAGQQTGPQP